MLATFQLALYAKGCFLALQQQQQQQQKVALVLQHLYRLHGILQASFYVLLWALKPTAKRKPFCSFFFIMSSEHLWEFLQIACPFKAHLKPQSLQKPGRGKRAEERVWRRLWIVGLSSVVLSFCGHWGLPAGPKEGLATTLRAGTTRLGRENCLVPSLLWVDASKPHPPLGNCNYCLEGGVFVIIY